MLSSGDGEMAHHQRFFFLQVAYSLTRYVKQPLHQDGFYFTQAWHKLKLTYRNCNLQAQ